MRVLLVDDEAPNRENLQELLKQYCPEVTVVAEADSVAEGVALIRRHAPELVLLDIRMQDGTGFDLLQQLGQVDFEVIFITAYDQYGIQAVKYAALDYLLKPVDIGELQAAIGKAQVKIGQKQKNERMEYLLDYLNRGREFPSKIALPLFHETLYVDVAEIIRCEANNTYTYFYLSSGEQVLVSQTLKEYELLLEPQGFLRTHQSHLVNIAFVRSWLKEDGGSLLLKDKTRVPVSKLNREKVKAVLRRQLGLQ
ncbi:LytTR family DNA-binding domain-containing protein [Paraflavisolibacter sp. H34]|uniref:LytR/AlgR family response regulator transcription factor n=1 Tax=Huijunlia imazamoxiresistens TaxID=3127457 RepID=UPI003018D121